jgi:hypothetical protein
MGNKSAKNKNLLEARKAKKDEFYTQLVDIENELKHYKDQFRGKIVYCNCDNPYESNFFKYFVSNFNTLGLKKLITTSYGEAYKVEINEVPNINKSGEISLEDIKQLLKHKANVFMRLKGNGDFRSEECIELLKQADIVVTNPPFSLFREYIAQLVEHNKKFLIIGNINAIACKECFKLIKESKMWLGASIHGGDREFRVPDEYPLTAAGYRIDNDGNKYIRVKGVRWWTNLDLDYEKRHKKLILYKKYTPEEYPKYDNYDAIEVSRCSDIPIDYDGVMGVPITFLDKYNPEQFEIVGWSMHNNQEMDGGYWRGGKSNATINGEQVYRRILIRNKKVVK